MSSLIILFFGEREAKAGISTQKVFLESGRLVINLAYWKLGTRCWNNDHLIISKQCSGQPHNIIHQGLSCIEELYIRKSFIYFYLLFMYLFIASLIYLFFIHLFIYLFICLTDSLFALLLVDLYANLYVYFSIGQVNITSFWEGMGSLSFEALSSVSVSLIHLSICLSKW